MIEAEMLLGLMRRFGYTLSQARGESAELLQLLAIEQEGTPDDE